MSKIKYEYPRIVFFGTPDFAVASLEAIVDEGFNVVGVVTAPDKPGGRGMRLQSSAVKLYAESNGLPLLQPEKLRNEEFVEHLRGWKADLQVVVAFRMLPEAVWSVPPMGTINVHGSLLPDYRGAAPVHWAVINGEKETGITTFALKHEIDTGNILLQESTPIGDDETTGEVYNRLMKIGGKVLVKTIHGLKDGTLIPIPQPGFEPAKHAPKIRKEDAQIDWYKPTPEVYNFIRGMNPFPGAWTRLDGKFLKVVRAGIVDENTCKPVQGSGAYDTDGKTYLHFKTADGCLAILELQPEGKKKMGVEEFLRGYRFK